MHEIILGPFTGLPPNANQTRGQHWSQLYKEQQSWQQTVRYAGLAHKPKIGQPFKEATVHIHVRLGTRARRDGDNLVGAFKPCIDGLKDILIEDDALQNIGFPQFSHEFVKGPNEFTITVTSK